jgi:hypothetical protein
MMCVYLREIGGNHEIWICDKVTEDAEFVWIKTRGSHKFYLEALQPGATERNRGFMSPIFPQDWNKFIGENDEFVDHCLENDPCTRYWKKEQVLSGSWFELDTEQTKQEKQTEE